jgi:prophage regulatory protein
MSYHLLRKTEVLSIYPKSHTRLYADINKGLFTKPVKLSARLSVWPQCEVEAIVNAYIAGKSEDAIRALVDALHRQRKEAAA